MITTKKNKQSMIQAEQDLLVLEAQNGNEKAFECLIVFFHPQLVNFASNLSGNHALAKDAVQDVWLKISKKLKSIEDPRAFKSWIFRAVRWRVLDLIKAKSYHFETIENEATEYKVTDETGFSVEIDGADIENQRLRKMINNLQAQERSVIYLFYMMELALAEIALILEIPAGTVKSRLNKARNSLRQQLQ